MFQDSRPLPQKWVIDNVGLGLRGPALQALTAAGLAERIILIEQGRIGLDMAIDLPRPRRIGSAKRAELEAQILERALSPATTAEPGRQAAN